MIYFQLISGFILLIGGAEFLVRGSAALAKKAGVSLVIIGMTVIALGTSAPELFVSVQAAYVGIPSLIVGNLVGSNVANILLIIGFAGIFTPIYTQNAFSFSELIFFLIGSFLFSILCFFGPLSFYSALILLLGFFLFLFRTWASESQRKLLSEEAHDLSFPLSMPLILLAIFFGYYCFNVGIRSSCDFFCYSGEELGVSEEIIGLTVIAFGTSLPELAAAAAAAIKKLNTITLGNIIGSNMFNILGVGGVSALLTPLPISQTLKLIDLPMMLVSSCIFVFFVLKGRIMGRKTALLFLITYTIYITVKYI